MLDKLDQLYREGFGWNQRLLDIVHFSIGCYVAPRMPGRPSPAWGVIIGPQSGGKSTILKAFDGYPFTYAVDHITPQGLTSCYESEDNPGVDHSLLGMLSEYREPKGAKVWIIQELSSFTSADSRVVEKQLADVRAASVGDHISHGGIGGTKARRVGQFGLLIGTTEAFELLRAKMSTFGDRFLCIRMADRADTPDELIQNATNAWNTDQAKMARLKQEIRDETHRVLDAGIGAIGALGDSSVAIALSDTLSKWTGLASLFGTSPVAPGVYATASGRPYRIVEQIKSWGSAHAVICGRTEWGPDEMRIAKRMFHDSMPRLNYDALMNLWPNGGEMRPTFTDLYIQWNLLGAVESSDGSVIQYGRPGRIQLTPAIRKIVAESGYLNV